jgi:hypothetical protein
MFSPIDVGRSLDDARAGKTQKGPPRGGPFDSWRSYLLRSWPLIAPPGYSSLWMFT